MKKKWTIYTVLVTFGIVMSFIFALMGNWTGAIYHLLWAIFYRIESMDKGE